LKDPSLEIVSTLLDINKGELQKWLCYRRIVSMKETYEKPMTAVEVRRTIFFFYSRRITTYTLSTINICDTACYLNT